MLIHAIAIAITLQINNVAHVPTGHLERAQQEVIRLYHNIGVEVAWTGPDAARATPAPDIRVVLVPYGVGDMLHREKLVMGAAVLTKLGTSVAYIFYREVEGQARQYDYSLPMILASAIAHEVGHLLLPDGRHSPEGLMRACWTRDDFHRANQGQLRFSNEQAAQIREGLQALVEHESRHRAGQELDQDDGRERRERPVPLANVANDRHDDTGDRGRQKREDASVQQRLRARGVHELEHQADGERERAGDDAGAQDDADRPFQPVH